MHFTRRNFPPLAPGSGVGKVGLLYRSRGGIGRRVRLRTVWGNPWRFESSREQLTSLTSEAQSKRLAGSDYLPAAFLRAAHRAFMSWESLLRPAAVSPPFLLSPAFPPVFLPPFCLAQRALAAADNLARVAAEIVRRPP